MKPNNLKLKTQAKGLARAKLMIRTHLYWLKGYPAHQGNEVIWNCPLAKEISNQKTVITAKKISKAARTINELVKDFPIALPRLVGDVRLWSSRCKNYLNYTKEVLKEPQDLFCLFEKEPSYAKKYNKQELDDSLQNFVRACSWMFYINRKLLSKNKQFITTSKDLLNSGISLAQFMQISCLSVSYGKKAKGLHKLYCHTKYFNVPTDKQSDYLQAYIDAQLKVNKKANYKAPKQSKFNKPDKPKNNNSSTLLMWLPWIISLNTSQQKNTLAFIEALAIESNLSDWSKWWQKVDKIIPKCENLILYADSSRKRELVALQNQLKSLQNNIPQSVDFIDIDRCFRFYIKNTDLSKSIIKLLNSLSAETVKLYPSKMVFLPYFELILGYGSINSKNLANYINHFSQYLNKQVNIAKTHPWSNLEVYYWGTAESFIFDELNMADVPTFFEVLSKTQQHTIVKQRNVDFICVVIKAGFNKQRCVEICSYFIQKNKTLDVSDIVLTIAKKFNDNNKNIAKLAKIWSKLNEDYTDDDTLEVIYKTFVGLNQSNLFRQIVLAGNVKKLQQACYQVRVIEKTKGKQALPAFTVAGNFCEQWLKSFPLEHHQELKELGSLTKQAYKKAQKIYSTQWWSKKMLLDSIESLQKQMKSSNQTQQQRIKPRLVNLQQRLDSHKTMTEQQNHNIRDKLLQLIAVERFNLWTASLDETFKQAWIELFKQTINSTPAWLFNENTIKQIIPIIDFKTKNKKLAQHIIQRRCCKPDCKFIKHPKNQAFIQRLQHNNVDTNCWVEGIGSYTYQTKNNEKITIDLAKDTLEILNMGGHFKTCLAPGSFNYFSVFANIADVNKQVIYAKDKNGTVIGRVLIAITSSAGLKVFTQYSHHPKYEFQQHVLNYIKKWAKEAKLILTNTGRVEKLISSSWYDDGAIQVDNDIACFKEGSTFRKQLPTIKPSDFVQTLKSSLAPLTINELTFLSLMRLDELKSNPLLMPTLIDMAYKISNLSIVGKLELYQLSNGLNHSRSCYHAFRKDFLKHFLSLIKNDRRPELEHINLVAKDSPSDALKIVKAYGRKQGKIWHNHLYHGYASVAIQALNQLGRENKAKKIGNLWQI